MLPGNATVYYNGQNFNNESSNSSGGEFPQGGASDSFDGALTAMGGPYASLTGPYNLNPLGGGTTTPNGNIATLVDLRNRFGRGNYRQDWIEQNLLAYERVGSAIVLLSNATSSTTSNGDFDTRTFATKFPVGTILEEYTGNAASTFADPQQNIPQFVTVVADTSANPPTGSLVTVRIPRNVQFNTSTSTTYATGDGYLVYGLPTPTGNVTLTNVASTLAGQTFSTSASNAGQLNGTDRFTTVSVIKASSFQLQLATNEALLNVTQGQPLVHDQNADGDQAQFEIDGGIDVTGAGLDTNPNSVTYGFQPFVTTNQPGYSANGGTGGNGTYAQTISTALIGQGYHYITVEAFTHNSDPTAPPVYTDWRQTIYVDTAPPLSTLVSFNETASSSQNRTLVIQSADGLANNTHVFLDLPSGLTNSQILAMISGSNQPAQTDVSLWQQNYTNLSSGNHVATVVSYKPDGTTNIQRFNAQQMPFLSVTGANGGGLGDLNGDSQFTSTDVSSLSSIVQGNGTSFNAAGDINGDGLINLTDIFLMGPLLTSHNATAATVSSYNSLVTTASYILAGTYNVTDSADTIYQDTAGNTTVQAGNTLTATSIVGSTSSTGGTLTINAGATVKIASLNTTLAGTSRLTSLTIASSSGAWTGKLDLNASDLLLEATPSTATATLATVTSQIKSAFDSGQWDGQGITSSAAATDPQHDHALGVVLNNINGSPLYSTFDGQAVDTSTILMKYTYYGDANLDGMVNGTDYTAIDNGFNAGLTGWNNGDFNYDGLINGDDYALIDNSFNMVGSLEEASSLNMVAHDTDQIAAPQSTSSVPEPSAIGLLGFAGFLARRRRTRHWRD